MEHTGFEPVTSTLPVWARSQLRQCPRADSIITDNPALGKLFLLLFLQNFLRRGLRLLSGGPRVCRAGRLKAELSAFFSIPSPLLRKRY